MSPRIDHKRPVIAFILLIVAAAAVVGNGMRASALIDNVITAGPVGVHSDLMTGERTPSETTSPPSPTSAKAVRHGDRARFLPMATVVTAATQPVPTWSEVTAQDAPLQVGMQGGAAPDTVATSHHPGAAAPSTSTKQDPVTDQGKGRGVKHRGVAHGHDALQRGHDLVHDAHVANAAPGSGHSHGGPHAHASH